MNLVRCTSCRTTNDLDQAPACAGCGRPLEATPARRGRIPLVQHEGARDGTRTGIVLAVLGVLAIPSLVSMIRLLESEEFGGAILFTLISVVLLGAMIWLPLQRRIRASRRNDLTKAVCFIMAFAAAVFGSGILVFLTCAGFS